MSDARKLLSEAFTGPELSVLQKYQIADENGEIRLVELNADERGMRKHPPAPIILPEVLTRLIDLDRTPDKHILDWIFYTAGGGAKSFAASEENLASAKKLLIANVMGKADDKAFTEGYEESPDAYDEFAKERGYADFHDMQRRARKKIGIAPDGLPIDPMTEEEAEAEWVQDEPIFRGAYFYGDEDVAKESNRPFAYFQKWPGRDGIYEKINSAVTKYNQLSADPRMVKAYNRWAKAKKEPVGFNVRFVDADGDALSPDDVGREVDRYQRVAKAVEGFLALVAQQKDKIAEYDQLNPQNKFKTNLSQYASPDDLVTTVSQFTRNLAKNRAQRNVPLHGKAKAPATGYTKGPDETIYEDEFMTVVIPATAGAALKKGWVKWCIASQTFWDRYWETGDPEHLYWAHPNYTRSSRKGVFGFWTFKVPMPTEIYQQLAGFFRLDVNCREGEVRVSAVEWTDKLNSAEAVHQCDIRKVERELAGIDPQALEGFRKSIEEVKAWVMQHKPGEDIEMAPALESLARKLVAMMLGEALRGTGGRLRL